MTTRALFDAALAETQNWHAALPAVSEFVPWPTDLTYQDRPPYTLSAAGLVQTAAGDPNPESAPLLSALQALAPHLEWRHTYSVDEVGQHFLDHFGWFEFAGPDGHFITHQTRITVGYWGAGLHYGRHQHDAIGDRLVHLLSPSPRIEALAPKPRLIAPTTPARRSGEGK